MNNEINYKEDIPEKSQSIGKTDEKVKIGWDDILAIMIAQFQILFPIALGTVVIVVLLLLFIMKVWLRQ